MRYIPLNIKTEYDLMNSLIKIDDLLLYAESREVKALGITDSSMFGTMEFIKKCESNNLKPVIGLEVTLNNYKVLIYARNYNGYLNMIKICTYQNDGSLNIDNLLEHKDDLYFLSSIYSFAIKFNLPAFC